MFTPTVVLFAVLIYALIGVLFLIAYILAMAPEKQTTILGLIMLFWPLVIGIELMLAFSAQFGKVGTVLANQLRKTKAA